MNSRVVILINLLLLAGCGGGGGSSDSNTEISTSNTTPVADTGVDQSVNTGSTVSLSGAASSDADGDSLTYTWSFSSIPTGSSSSLSSTSSEAVSFVADVDGVYVASLVANDGTDNSAADTVSITATSTTGNSAPVANAGTDRPVSTTSTVELSAVGSSDANGDTLTYLWSLSTVPAGSNAVLSSTSSVETSFTADVDGVYVAILVVNDGTIDGVADTISLSASAGGGVLTLSSNALKSNLILPLSATCDAVDRGTSIDLFWTNTPTDTQSFAITMHQYPNPADEGDLSKAHSYWTLYDIPATTSVLGVGETAVGIFGTNTVDSEQTYTAPCSAGAVNQTYTITLYALSSSVGSLGLTGSSTDIVTLTDAIASSTLETATLALDRLRYNPNETDYVPTAVPNDCDTKSAAFADYSNLVEISCDEANNRILITTLTKTPERTQLQEDKMSVGITEWIGRATLPETATFQVPLSPTYTTVPTGGNLNIHHPIGITVDGLPILSYVIESDPDELFDPSIPDSYSDRDMLTLGQIDQCGGHGANGESYHYHYAPLCMLDTHDFSQPVAYMYDGLPLYFGTGGGLPVDGDEEINYGGGRFTELDYRPPTVKAGTDSLDGCNAFDLNGDGSEYVYYTTKERPYTIGCYRAEADQANANITGPPSWESDHLTSDPITFGKDVILTDYDIINIDAVDWFYIEIVPQDINTNLEQGKVALMMWRQVASDESEYRSTHDCFFFRYRLDDTITDGSADTIAGDDSEPFLHCRLIK